MLRPVIPRRTLINLRNSILESPGINLKQYIKEKGVGRGAWEATVILLTKDILVFLLLMVLLGTQRVIHLLPGFGGGPARGLKVPIASSSTKGFLRNSILESLEVNLIAMHEGR